MTDVSSWVKGAGKPRSTYPFAHDSAETLFSVVDGCVSKLLAEWKPGDSTIELDPAVLATNNFPESGFVTLYLPEGSETTPGEKRSVTLAYSGKLGWVLTGVFKSEDGPAYTISFPAGSAAIGNVVSEHYEAVRSAVMALERRVGALRCPSPGSLEHLIRKLTSIARRPKPWFEVFPRVGVVGTRFRFSDRTTRVRLDDYVETFWDFGDGTDSSEKNPEHSYALPGEYTVALTVKTSVGEESIALVRCVKIIGSPPLPASVSIEPGSAVAGETEVFVRVERSPSPTDDQVVSHAWDLGSGFASNLPDLPAFKVVPSSGGVFPVRVKRTTVSGAYSWESSPVSLNVVERGSAWIVSSPTSRNLGLRLDEFVPSSDSWKTIVRPLGTRRALAAFPSADPTEAREETWATDGALIQDASSHDLRFFYSANDRQVRCEVCDVLTGVWESEEGSRYRGWGWRAARIAARGVPVEISGKTFLFFGALTPEGLESLESTNVDEFDSETKTWRIHTLPVTAEVTLRTIGADTPGGRVRWRISGWEDHFYMLRSSSVSDAFSRMFRYYPFTRIWEDMGEQKWSGVGIDVRQGELVGMSQSLYFFSHRRRSYGYAPRRGLWFTTDYAPQWSDSRVSSELDQDRLVKASAGIAPGSASNNVAYAFSPYSSRATGKFDEVAGIAKTMPERPVGHAWAIGRL